jgi:hypothetical protein
MRKCDLIDISHVKGPLIKRMEVLVESIEVAALKVTTTRHIQSP